jgi:sugar lactone lactonase YvrE
VDVYDSVRDLLGEGPHWDARSGTLLRVDQLTGAVHRLDPQTGHQETIETGQRLAFAIPGDDDDLLVGSGHSLLRMAPDGTTKVLAQLSDVDDDICINDGKCDSAGRLFFGTFSAARRTSARFYSVTGAGSPTPLFGGVTVSNGLGWDDPRDRFYWVDTWSYTIDVFDRDAHTGALSRRWPFVRFDSADGLPDGLAVDADGGVWIALITGGAIRRYDPDGALTEVVDLPVSCPTSLAFGGPDLSTLFVTTSRHRLDSAQRDEEVLAGCVLALQVGVRGAAVHGFVWNPGTDLN